jgi:hypothetical protein
MDRLTLSSALAQNRLAEFVDQAEREGIGPVDAAALEALMGRVIEPPRADQTSRLSARDGSRGK